METKSAQTALTPKPKKSPSIKQQLVFKKVVENGVTVTQAMREVGYAETTVNNPNNVTDSDTWKALLKKHIPLEKLSKKLDEGLEANKQLAARVIFKKEAPTSQSAGELPVANSQTDDFIEVPDMAVRHKYLETALKVSGLIIEKKDITSDGEKLEPVQVVIVEDNSMSNE